MTNSVTHGLLVLLGPTSRPLIHPRWVRVTHWLNALAMLVMIGSGWQIYDAAPLFRPLHFPRAITLGEWLGGGLLWHFAAMWLLMANGVVYIALGLATGRFRQKLFPIHAREVMRDTVAALRAKLSHDDLTVYNAVQKLLYLGVVVTGIVIVASGLSIWKPVQFHLLTAIFGGYETGRYVHFAAMTAIVAFLAIHVTLALLVPKSLRAMINGR